ncbi:Gfo/Idh/MocA family protein [Hellea balneolensis]|uniref:Gfo/Idh/MocA family protein n=1 Tax=Hellea balneolensis TaxID=287478 RepID=UPI00041AAD7A|nr:Gfo/Idh/MocA family oxidoreductase [Hellea balneolensis]
MTQSSGKIRMGMVGGGQGAFIGDVHRLAARLDGDIELVCGAFSRDPENCRITGEALGVAPARSYTDFNEMMRTEAALPANERMEFVAIVTPNHVHFPVAKAALEAGFSVLSDKPATLNLEEALELRKIVQANNGLAYGLTHTYLGYPLVGEARGIIESGGIGKVRKVFVEYIQGWLATEVENKQADWRTDPARSGGSGCMGDIGTHAHNLAEFMTGKRMTHVAADLSIFVEGRRLDDDGSALFKMEDGVKGTLSASQVCVGVENGLSIRVYGETGGLEWHQEEPNTLKRTYSDRPTELIRAAQGYLSEGAQGWFRTPPGHPEGYIEAFANCYREFGKALRSQGGVASGIDAAVRGMAFIEALLESSENDSAWTEIKQ